MHYDQKMLDGIRSIAIPLKNISSDYDVILAATHDAQIVLIGEASHGTHEFYDIRAQITKRLITEQGFHAVSIEGDWPDAYQVNRFIHQQTSTKAAHALASFDRFPTWMWRNVPMVQFIDWLREHNQVSENKVSLYGLDLYSLYRSVDAVITCLEKIDPAASAEARYYYSCFEQYRHDPQAYGYAVARRVIASCADIVIEELKRLQEQDWEHLSHGEISAEEAFYIEQNARVVKNAENYYRSLFVNETSNWNIRDSHMLETVNALIIHYQLKGIEKPKIIIWAHNSHIGNAAATQMSKQGEYNIGQLVKEQFGTKNAIAIGFTTYQGTVSAASDWHQPVERKNVREALATSYEALFHAVKIPSFLLVLKDATMLPHESLERAIGVIYHPQTERMSHYFYANLREQFDIIIHCDTTCAIEPLEKTSQWIAGEVPETYPSGL